MIRRTRKHEEQVGEPIDVRQEMRVDILGTQRHDRALGSPANRAREMEQGACVAAAWKNESAKRRQIGFEAIDPAFEPLSIGIADRGLRSAVRNLLGRIGEARTNGKQVVLQTAQQLADIGGQIRLRQGYSKAGVQLIDVAVGRHARVGFLNAGTAKKPRVTAVAGARVNLHGRQYKAGRDAGS
jgi:hypothetical protein